MDVRDRLLREAYVSFVASNDFDPIFRRLHRPPRFRYIVAAFLALTGGGIPLAIGIVIGAQR